MIAAVQLEAGRVDASSPEILKQTEFLAKLHETRREYEDLKRLMETERRILPLPKRRVTSGVYVPTTQEVNVQNVTAATSVLFNRLHNLNNDLNILEQRLESRLLPLEQAASDSSRLHIDDYGGLDESEEDDLEDDDDDECTGCRDWLENVKNKKKRKIPTSAVMGHTNSISSPIQQGHGTTLSPGRGSKAKTRRRRTWDVSSEARPDSTFRATRENDSVSPPTVM